MEIETGGRVVAAETVDLDPYLVIRGDEGTVIDQAHAHALVMWDSGHLGWVPALDVEAVQ
jgi:hypothetical protein